MILIGAFVLDERPVPHVGLRHPQNRERAQHARISNLVSDTPVVRPHHLIKALLVDAQIGVGHDEGAGAVFGNCAWLQLNLRTVKGGDEGFEVVVDGGHGNTPL
ncbi:MAG: hypothetical protein EI684_19955 [Candidatus Viridilinea halotolerans]|uniref:Uncharacterized protein n=1 Tax=Candidatus Viridilinea halotolerans TaxID=2491704 RepID=A0A426TSE7_9CHLR|nr:MAG: hypothetical protein EI684_19955 [Candidatus Viridilinea halotolerans]